MSRDEEIMVEEALRPLRVIIDQVVCGTMTLDVGFRLAKSFLPSPRAFSVEFLHAVAVDTAVRAAWDEAFPSRPLPRRSDVP
jgi:hypothetical protein